MEHVAARNAFFQLGKEKVVTKTAFHSDHFAFVATGGVRPNDIRDDVGNGAHVVWGDAVLLADGSILKIWKDAGIWRSQLGSGAVVDMVLTAAPYTRLGLFAAGNAAYLWYLTTDFQLCRARWDGTTFTPDPFGSFALHDANGQTLAFNTAAIHPIDAERAVLVGCTTSLVWACVMTHSVNGWVAGTLLPIAAPALTGWEAMATDAVAWADNIVLSVPSGRDGRSCAALIYPDGTVSALYPLIATTTEANTGRRLWLYSLNIIMGRIWGIAYQEFEGDPGRFYAGQSVLVSSPDGVRWRDEGTICAGDLRGKLFLTGERLVIATSPTATYTSPVPYRIDPSEPMVSLAATTSLQINHGGLGNTISLTLNGMGEDLDRILPGDRIAVSTGTADDQVQLFSGYVDSCELDLSAGGADNQWSARGLLGQMIGDTAYVPPTTLTWDGRQGRYCNFQTKDGKTTLMGLAGLSGNWNTAAGPFRAFCTISSIATFPIMYKGNGTTYAWADLQTSSGFYISFWISSNQAAASDQWRVGIINNLLVIDKIVAGHIDRLGTFVVPSLTANMRVTLGVWISPSTIFAQIILPSYIYTRVLYTRTPQSVEPAPPEQFSIGMWGEAPLTTCYEIGAVGGDVPMTIGQALQRAGEIAGVNIGLDPDRSLALGDWTLLSPVFDLEISAPQDGMSLMFWWGLIPTQLIVNANSIQWGTKTVVFPTPLAYPTSLRLTAHDDIIAVYQHDRLLAAFHHVLGDNRITMAPVSPVGHVILHGLSIPVMLCQWSYGQQAQELLSNVLERRRVYLVERGDGSVVATETHEGKYLTGSDELLPYYNNELWSLKELRDARGLVSLVGIIGAGTPGSHIFYFDETLPSYGKRATVNDNPWLLDGATALDEAQKVIRDARMAYNQRQGEGLVDPTIGICDLFHLKNGAVWMVDTYTIQIAITDQEYSCYGSWSASEKP